MVDKQQEFRHLNLQLRAQAAESSSLLSASWLTQSFLMTCGFWGSRHNQCTRSDSTCLVLQFLASLYNSTLQLLSVYTANLNLCFPLSAFRAAHLF